MSGQDDHVEEYDDAMVAMLELIWGEGFMAPGGADTVHRIVRGLDLRDKLLLDIGCGIGSVLMMTAWKHPAATCVGVEAQSLSWAMACRSIRYNGASARVEARHGDLRDASVVPEGASFDLVTGTPPYFKITQTKTKKTKAQNGGAGGRVGGDRCTES